MNNRFTNFLLAGVGGQGVLVGSEILARTAICAGYEAKKSEIHGVSQRGGSVISHVRYGEKVYSPLTQAGDIHVLIAFEMLEGLRWAHTVKLEGHIIFNSARIQPSHYITQKTMYPENIYEFLKGKDFKVHRIDAPELAKNLGNPKVESMVLLGAASRLLDFDKAHWEQTIKDNVPPKTIDVNLEAFQSGRDAFDG